MSSGQELSLIGEVEVLRDEKPAFRLGSGEDDLVVAALESFRDDCIDVQLRSMHLE